MSVGETSASQIASVAGATSGDGLSPTTSAADLMPTAAWSRRVRWIGGLIQAAFAAFWLVRASLVVGGRAADLLIAVSSVAVIGVFSYAIRATAGTARGPRPRRPSGSSETSRSPPSLSSPRRSSCPSS